MTTGQRTLGGRYELGGLLGTGGMAEVYLGRDTRLDRDVAIKLLRDELNSDPSFIARFRREAQSAASLNHHNIVAVYDTGDDDGTPYIVMEYVEGRTLRDVLRGEGPMYPRRALEVTSDVCSALAFSHAAGIIHRDIKPANVMLTKAGTVKVMDFGIARAMTSSVTMTQTAAVMGTAQYLSPEQARGEHVDARSDLYSTGCLLYELVAGRAPFVGDSPVSVAYQHVREQPVAPSQLNRDISPAIDSVVLKAMAKNPGNRYQSADEMREDLLSAAAGRAVQATPVLHEDATQVLQPVPAASATRVMRTNARPAATPAKRAGRGLGYFLLLSAVVGVFLVAGLALRAFLDNKAKAPATSAPVPSIVGKTLTEATKILSGAGLVVDQVAETPDNTGKVKKGIVIKQSPAPPFKLKKGESVDLTVSSGIERKFVPRIVQLPLPEALEELRKAGLRPAKEITVEQDPNAAPNSVLRTDPVAGQEVNANSEVKLWVAAGTLKVPSVLGMPREDATTTLENAGFRVRFNPDEFSDQPLLTVLKQSVAAGTELPRNSLVVL
ncbi:MAG: Stk1 family PASTA domain-containing Ser/Thr kinase, partial [Mycobacteriales bacterium]